MIVMAMMPTHVERMRSSSETGEAREMNSSISRKAPQQTQKTLNSSKTVASRPEPVSAKGYLQALKMNSAGACCFSPSV